MIGVRHQLYPRPAPFLFLPACVSYLNSALHQALRIRQYCHRHSKWCFPRLRQIHLLICLQGFWAIRLSKCSLLLHKVPPLQCQWSLVAAMVNYYLHYFFPVKTFKLVVFNSLVTSQYDLDKQRSYTLSVFLFISNLFYHYHFPDKVLHQSGLVTNGFTSRIYFID